MNVRQDIEQRIEQRMHYQMQLKDALKKKKAALTAVCSLGLSETPLVKLFRESDTTRKQMSFGHTPAGWVFQILWFGFLTVITMAIFWVINIFKLINYADLVNRLQKKINSL